MSSSLERKYVTMTTKLYGVWNNKKKEFQFDIVETSKNKASQALFEKIGKDAYKWRFEIKELKSGNPKAKVLLDKYNKLCNT